MAKPVTVLFDIDHTLAFDNRLELTVLHKMCEELEQNVTENKQQILAHFDKGASKQFEKIRAGTVRIEAALTEQFAHLAEQIPQANIHPTALSLEYIDRVIKECENFLRTAPGAEALLHDLKRAGYHVGVLSNGWLKLQQRKMELVGYQGPLFVSDEIGYWKPHVKAFEVALAGLGADASTSLYVGDSPSSDVVGAHAAGMTAAWVNWEGEPFPAGLAPPDYELRHLDELRDLLLD